MQVSSFNHFIFCLFNQDFPLQNLADAVDKCAKWARVSAYLPAVLWGHEICVYMAATLKSGFPTNSLQLTSPHPLAILFSLPYPVSGLMLFPGCVSMFSPISFAPDPLAALYSVKLRQLSSPGFAGGDIHF